jgi:hypothetical protein
MRTILTCTQLLLLVLACAPQVSAQTGETAACGGIAYADKNMIDYKVAVSSAKGIVRDFQQVSIPGACVGIFSEPGHKLLGFVQTNGDGAFQFTGLRDGIYRLVIRYDSFCPANAILQIKNRSRKRRSLIVVMKVSGIDDCSYVTLKNRH